MGVYGSNDESRGAGRGTLDGCHYSHRVDATRSALVFCFGRCLRYIIHTVHTLTLLTGV
jgi:hypothetical protein